MKKHLHFLLLVSLVGVQFNGSAQQYKAAEVEYKQYTVSAGKATDSTVLNLLKPYSDSLNKILGQVIGFATATLYNKQPEGPLGNFAADAMRAMAAQEFNTKVDVAVINSGGLRSHLPKGEITLRHIYEVMPFDNLVVLQELSGVQLKAFLDHAANKGGWGVSGIAMTIKNRQADSIYINNVPLDPAGVYIMASTDYIANGGDYSEMLKGIRMLNTGYLYRDALIEYILLLTKQGKAISAKVEKRVTNADQ